MGQTKLTKHRKSHAGLAGAINTEFDTLSQDNITARNSFMWQSPFAPFVTDGGCRFEIRTARLGN